MKKTTCILVLTAVLALAGAAESRAQTAADEGRITAQVDIGAQTNSRTLATSTSFPLYDETATVITSQQIGAGPVFDFGGAYRVWDRLSVGLLFTTFSHTQDGSATATIPSPVFYNQPVTTTVASQGLKRFEFGTHIQFIYDFPINDKFTVAVSGGPSFIHVSQDITTITVPGGTNTSVAVEKQTGTAKGGNIGVDVDYAVTPRYLAAFFMRYAGGSVDLPAVSSVKAGGFQIGVGLRAKF